MTDVLIISGEAATADLIRDYLEMHDISAEAEGNADIGLAKVCAGDYGMLVYDRDTPGISADVFLARVREAMDLPILALSAVQTSSKPQPQLQYAAQLQSLAEAELIRALEEGADAYMSKPIRPGEVTARVQAMLRFYERVHRANAVDGAMMERRGIAVDGVRRRVRVRGREKRMTRKEYDLLCFLMRHPDEVYTREQLYREVWGMEAAGGIATVTVHIKKLRDLVEEKPKHPTIIVTEWGTGYSFHSEEQRSL